MFSFKGEHLVNDVNGVNWLFKTMTMQPETFSQLKGKGHEVSDLKKVMDVYKHWHMIHCPKLENSFFIEKVRKMHSKDKEVGVHLQKLRNHYKGEEMLEEFENVFGDEDNKEADEY